VNLKDELSTQVTDLSERLEKLEVEARPLREQLGNIDRTKHKLSEQLKEIRNKVDALKKEPRVSDHAVVRYLERIYGFSFEDVRKELLTPVVIAAMAAGVDTVKTAKGKLKIRENCVVTVTD